MPPHYTINRAYLGEVQGETEKRNEMYLIIHRTSIAGFNAEIRQNIALFILYSASRRHIHRSRRSSIRPRPAQSPRRPRSIRFRPPHRRFHPLHHSRPMISLHKLSLSSFKLPLSTTPRRPHRIPRLGPPQPRRMQIIPILCFLHHIFSN